MRGEVVQRLAFVAMAGSDVHGNPAPQRAEAVDVLAQAFAPEASKLVDGAVVTTAATLFLPFDFETHPLDLWRCRGRLYAVDGDEAQWSNPLTARRFGRAVPLRRVTG